MRPTVASGLHEWSFGITMVHREAEAALAFPDPSTDAAEPWMWWMGSTEFESSLDTKVFPIDSKSKRVFREGGDVLRGIFDNDGVANTIGFSLRLRTLYALP